MRPERTGSGSNTKSRAQPKLAPVEQETPPSSQKHSPKSSHESSPDHNPGHSLERSPSPKRSQERNLDRKQQRKRSPERNSSRKQQSMQPTVNSPLFGVPQSLAGIIPAQAQSNKKEAPLYGKQKTAPSPNSVTSSPGLENRQQQHRIPKIAPCSLCRCLYRMAPRMDPS